MRIILEPKFFDRSALTVGLELIGKYLIRTVNGREVALPITEVEVYDGFEDRASHAFRGKTLRNQVMFGDAGHFYVYLVYGMYFMLNVVVGKKEYPAAILIRGAGECVGPGKLSKFLQIDRTLNGKLAVPSSGLWFENRGKRVKGRRIKRTPRIGVGYAGAPWSEKLYRFVLESPQSKSAVKKKVPRDGAGQKEKRERATLGK